MQGSKQQNTEKHTPTPPPKESCRTQEPLLPTNAMNIQHRGDGYKSHFSMIWWFEQHQ